jgi:hypothetical protein
MKRVWFIIVLPMVFLTCLALEARPKRTLIVVNRPTVVAFCPHVSDAEMSKDPDTNEALSDFQVYARGAREKLRKAGVDFEELYVDSFEVKCEGKTTVFRPGKIKIGYYFIAPGKPPRIQYGVMTDDDILQTATEYFHLASK